MKPRLLLLVALLSGALAAGGCTQRETNNPFIGPNGAANETPFGALPSPASAPHRG